MTAAYTIDVVRTIRKNAGRVPAREIAAALGWTPDQLDNVAAKHQIDLRLYAMRASDSAPRATFSTRVPLPERRSEHFGVRLRVADAAILREKAATLYVAPGQLLAQVFEGALARGKIEQFASAARAYRPGEAPGGGEGA